MDGLVQIQLGLQHLDLLRGEIRVVIIGAAGHGAHHAEADGHDEKQGEEHHAKALEDIFTHYVLPRFLPKEGGRESRPPSCLP